MNQLLAMELCHAKAEEKYSRSFLVSNSDLISDEDKLYLGCNVKHGVDDNQKFRSSDNKEITLPVLLLSRYFAYFEPLLSDRWIKEDIVSIDLPNKDLRHMLCFLTCSVYHENCDKLFDYFQANIQAYLFVIYPLDYNNREMINKLGEMLKCDQFKEKFNKLYSHNQEMTSLLYFCANQDLLRINAQDNDSFTAEFHYRSDIKLGIQYYMSYCESRDIEIDNCWIWRYVRSTYEIENSKWTGKIMEENGNRIIRKLHACFTGILDDNDKDIIISILSIIARVYLNLSEGQCAKMILYVSVGMHCNIEQFLESAKLITEIEELCMEFKKCPKWILRYILNIINKIRVNTEWSTHGIHVLRHIYNMMSEI